MTESRYIPKKVDMEVKKASGFKCAWCGCYLTERHHIYQFSLVKSHSEDNLILLCPNCHTEADSGKISAEELIKRKMSLSGKVDRSSGCLSINKEYPQIDVGGNHFINCQNILMLNDMPLISVRNDNGYLLISLRLFNEDGNLICWMNENRWWVENEEILDFKHSRNGLSITDNDDNRVLELEIRDDLVEIVGSLYLLGDVVKMLKDKIIFKKSGNQFIDCTFKVRNAIVIKEKSFRNPIPGGAGILLGV